MDAAADLPVWLRALEPLAVPFVILLMLAGWLLERRRDGERRRRCDARMRATAYELLIVLVEWRTAWPMWAHPEVAEEEDDPTVPEILSFGQRIHDDVEEARQLARGLVTEAPAASGHLAEMAEEVYPRVIALTVVIRTLVGDSTPLTEDAGWIRHWRDELGKYRESHLDRAIGLLEVEVEDLVMFPS